jgi:hypothetical protein
MDWQFPIPHLRTDTTISAGRGDGFGNNDSVRRTAYARARMAGIDPNGKTFCANLADERGHQDPAAWVPHSEFRGHVRRVCEKRGYACNGSVNVKAPAKEDTMMDRPYQVAEDLVEQEVDNVVQDQHEGHITPKKRADLKEELAEKLAGTQ